MLIIIIIILIIILILWNKLLINLTFRFRNLKTRFQENTRYVKTNSPQSAYAQHILHNQHEYGTLTESITLLKTLQKESMLLPFEQFHIQAGKLIPEQYLNDPNPIFQLTFSHPHHTHYKTETVNQQAFCKPDT